METDLIQNLNHLGNPIINQLVQDEKGKTALLKVEDAIVAVIENSHPFKDVSDEKVKVCYMYRDLDFFKNACVSLKMVTDTMGFKFIDVLDAIFKTTTYLNINKKPAFDRSPNSESPIIGTYYPFGAVMKQTWDEVFVGNIKELL